MRGAMTLLATVLAFALTCTDGRQDAPASVPASTAIEQESLPDAMTEALGTTADAAPATEDRNGYFTGTIPPCTPVEGAAVDPCQQNVPRISYVHTALWAGTEPVTIADYMEGHAVLGAFLVVRATYLVESVRCRNYMSDRLPSYMGGQKEFEIATGIGVIRCYADVRVNEYIAGSGPARLTVIVSEIHRWDERWTDEHVEQERNDVEQLLVKGGHDWITVPTGGIEGREEVLFIGPAVDYTIEAWQAHTTWDVERKQDGTVIVVHPWRNYWLAQDASTYRPMVEMTLATFKQNVQTFQTKRIDDYGGRVDARLHTPVMQTDATKLHAFHVSQGNTTHPDGPPALPPPACGFAVNDSRNNPGLVQDCFALLEALDELQGTAGLNWSVDTAIESWEGVSVAGTPQRVTELDLRDKNLMGSIPAALAKLELRTLRLTGNSLTGCIPAGLRDVAVNDLAQFNRLYCDPGHPTAVVETLSGTSVSLSWTAVADAIAYRVEYKPQYWLAQPPEWTEADSTITTTTYTVSDLKCETDYLFRLRALGSGTIVAASWSDPSPSIDVATAECAPSAER